MGGSRCNDLVESFTFTIMIVMVLMTFYDDFYDLFSDDFEAFFYEGGKGAMTWLTFSIFLDHAAEFPALQRDIRSISIQNNSNIRFGKKPEAQEEMARGG